MLQTYTKFEDMLESNATVDPAALGQRFLKDFKKQLMRVDRNADSTSSIPASPSIPPRALSMPPAQLASQAVSLATFKDLMNQLNSQIKDINDLESQVSMSPCIVGGSPAWFDQVLRVHKALEFSAYSWRCTGVIVLPR